MDASLLYRFKRADKDAFLAVYDLFAPDVRGVAYRFFRSPFEREEAVQEVWLLVHRMCDRFDPQRGELGAWLHEQIASGEDPSASVQESRLREAVSQFAATLDEEEGRIFQLSCVEEKSHEEVARLIGISPRRCKYLRMKLLARAAEDPRLRAVLEEVLAS
jgi:RNA polymerase sigma-70 factor (ECF subfamily)